MPDAREVSITPEGKIRVATDNGAAVIPPELLRQLMSDESLKCLVRAKLLKWEQLTSKE